MSLPVGYCHCHNTTVLTVTGTVTAMVNVTTSGPLSLSLSQYHSHCHCQLVPVELSRYHSHCHRQCYCHCHSSNTTVIGSLVISTGCGCNKEHTIGRICDESGKCSCKKNYDGDSCEKCSKGYSDYPLCKKLGNVTQKVWNSLLLSLSSLFLLLFVVVVIIIITIEPSFPRLLQYSCLSFSLLVFRNWCLQC